jgi:hypothetical protein
VWQHSALYWLFGTLFLNLKFKLIKNAPSGHFNLHQAVAPDWMGTRTLFGDIKVFFKGHYSPLTIYNIV